MSETIDDVIACMDRQLDRAVATNHASGYFTAVYRAVTARVRDGVAAGEFDDVDRMERFDVRFARLYLDAADVHAAGGTPSRSWRVAFSHAERPLLVLQHVLLGMNAHINLDLGIAAARTVPGQAVRELEGDFERINDVLADMIDRMQAAIATVSPWTAWVDRVGLRLDEALTAWSLQHARGRAWDFATTLAEAGDGQPALIDQRDAAVARLGTAIAQPGRATRGAIAFARRRERADVGNVVAALRDQGAPVPA